MVAGEDQAVNGTKLECIVCHRAIDSEEEIALTVGGMICLDCDTRLGGVPPCANCGAPAVVSYTIARPNGDQTAMLCATHWLRLEQTYGRRY